ncbi:site-specific DNA-methyltransferase [Salmonella enterica subsp. enterica serovar Alachua]|nr:site-specific DNA-methyltransferase [Salmonella enterica subsp. enterica serovar Alachua]
MQNTVNLNSVTLVNADAFQFITTLPNNSVDLILTDPPYFRVKPNGWDNQWRGDEDYLAWLDGCLAEFWRILKPNGSIYLFSGHRLAADIELLMRARFNVLNHIIWAKPFGRWNGCRKEDLRSYFPATERILFAECKPGPYKPDEFSQISGNLKRHIMTPLIDYFRNARESLGISLKDIALATGKKNMVSHWFGGSQWQLPNETDYRVLQTLFDRISKEKHQRREMDKPHHQLVVEYKTLNRQYLELVEEYRRLRRPFTVTASVPYTDVWTYKPVQFYPGKHPCEKPADMLSDMINASSRPGDLVVDFFMGSGSTVKAAIKLGRSAIGVELERERFEQTRQEIEAMK